MVRARQRFVACVCFLGLLFSAFIAPAFSTAPRLANAAPPGFVDELVATLNAHDIPTGIALTPDGRVLITVQTGQLRVVANGALLPAPALNLTGAICADGERGLQSVAVDPGFALNAHIFVFYTAPNAGGSCSGALATNRVMRYTLVNNIAQNPTPIMTEIPTGGGFHNGGDLQFGADGMLYISTGDGGSALGGGPNAINNDNARYLSLLNGKILRIASDGSIPADNPFVNTPGSVVCGGAPWNKNGGVCKEVFATGLRNPFKIAFKDGTNQFHINDVGQNHWEEINVGEPGADYGWNVREGVCPAGVGGTCSPGPATLAEPLHAISHSGGFCSITGGAFSNPVWPAPYADSYFFANYCDRTIYRLVPGSGGSFTREPFHAAPGSGGTVALRFDPATKSLYYSLADNFSVDGTPGVVRRIRSTVSVNRPPIAIASVAPYAGDASGGRFIWSGTTPSQSCPSSVSSGGWAAWTINVPTTASYALWLRTSAPNTASDSLCVQIDNGPVQTWGTPLSTGWVWSRQGAYALTAGAHTIRIRYRERGTRLDRLFTTNTSAAP
jgi:glucose/arabinose dehydrogenase